MNKTSRYRTEDYIFKEGWYDFDNDVPAVDDRDETEQDAVRGPKSQPNTENSDEEKAMHVNDVIRHEPIIQKIRETAIEGLKKYAEDPTSSLYEFFKKVFLESDKVLTGGSK